MLTGSSSGMNRVVTSLKVAALVTVLGAVVLAAEQQLTTAVPPEQAAVGASATPQKSTPDRDTGQASDYLPAQLLTPSGPVADLPPTF
jgi:hypothetical protein